MVVKVYISGISGNKEVKKRQQRVLMILDSKNITYDVIDITEPGRETDKDFMQNNAKSNGGTVSDPNPRSPLPPQLFNDEEYCGDYDQFDLANEVDTLEQFLKLEVAAEVIQTGDEKDIAVNGDAKDTEDKVSKEETEVTTAKTIDTDAPEDSPNKEASPAKDTILAKEGTPSNESTTQQDEKNISNEHEPEQSEGKAELPENLLPVSQENETADPETAAHEGSSKKSSKESTPDVSDTVNENGRVSSREQSEENSVVNKELSDAIIDKEDNSSEALIHSEQQAAAE